MAGYTCCIGALLALQLVAAGAWAAPAATEPTLEQLQAENARLRRELAALVPQQPYIVVDTAGNQVSLVQGNETLREMRASCGSGNVLVDPVGDRRWVFDTPRGAFTIQSTVVDPVWMKPDWAYLESGQPIPTKRAERMEKGVLGDYALGLGEGYYIHGTLFTRSLGRNGSHGCIRLGDEDLKTLYQQAPRGTRVIIF